MADSTSLASVIPPETIQETLLDPNLPVPQILQLVDSDAVGPGLGATVSIAKHGEITVPAGGKAENAEFEIVDWTDTDVTVTPDTVGFSWYLSSESSHDAIVNAFQTRAQNAVRYLANRVDEDGFLQFQSATNTRSFTGADLTDDRILTAIADLALQDPNVGPEGFAFCLRPIAIRDLGIDLNSAGGTYLGGDAESERVAQMFGPSSGFKGVRHGLRIFQSNNVPTTGTDANAAMFAMGTGGALAYRSWQTLMVEDRYLPRRKAWEVTVSVRYGWVIQDQEQMLEVVVDDAA